MKIGVIVETLQLPLRQGIECAARLGCEGIQTYATNPEFNLLERTAAEALEMRKFIRANNLQLTSVTGDLPGHGYTDAAEIPERVRCMKRFIDMALEMDCQIITNHIGVVPDDAAAPEYARMVETLQELCEYAAKRGSYIAIETGPEPATILKPLLTDVNSAGLGINLDPANLKMVLDADPAESVRILGRHIIHTHAKDGIHYQKCDPKKIYDAFAEGGFEALVAQSGKLFEEVPLGQGQVDWDAYLQALRQVGYNGFLTIEREVGADPQGDIAAAIAFLQSKLQ